MITEDYYNNHSEENARDISETFERDSRRVNRALSEEAEARS